MVDSIPRWLQWLGLILLVCSLGFLVERIWVYREWLIQWRPAVIQMLIAVIAIPVYASSQFLLSTAWCRLLRLGGGYMHQGLCHRIYGSTQIAKYLPGNMFHFAGRHIAGHSHGVGHFALISASIQEVLGVLVAAGLVGTTGMLVWHQEHHLLTPLTGGLILAGSLGGSLVLSLLINRKIPAEGEVRPSTNSAQTIISAYSLQLLFIVNTGFLVVAVTWSLSVPLSVMDAGAVITAFAVAWIAGFLTPGAPGGLGVREASLILLLTPVTGERNALAIAIVMRLITTLGDLVFFSLSSACGRCGGTERKESSE